MDQILTNETRYSIAYHAFIVGINAYTIVSPLHTAVNDAKKLSSLLEEKYDYQTHLCISPTGKELIAYIEDMATKIGEDDCVLFYFAGHGVATDSYKGLKGFIVPTDGDINNEGSLISMSFLLSAFSKLNCKHFLLILDCCFAGAFRWAEKYRDTARYEDTLFQQHYHYYIQNPSWQVLTSTSHTQKAIDSIFGTRETIEAQHSPFATCLINGLKGAADRNEDKIITTAELYSYLQERITTITGNQGNLQNVGFFPLEMHGNGEFMFIPKGFDPSTLTVKNYENPYMGLQAYTDEQKDLFFGRKKAIEELLAKTFENTLIVVVGASGTGKSSLVKAGVLPILKQKGLKCKEMRPGKDPLAELSYLNNDFEVLVIDQFEELITQSYQDSASKFIEILREWVQLKKKKIIVTVRIDFEPQIDKTGMEAAWKVGRFLIPPFTPEELREVIITPAARVGRFIEPITLVDEIISEVVHYSGSLPLLSFTMSELFQKCKENLYRNIRQADYEALGGVTGSLQKSADRIVESLNEAEQHTLKHIMLRMVSISGGEIAGKRVMLKDLEFNTIENQNVKNVLDKLTEARLIVRNTDAINQPYVEPVHDALIRGWIHLLEWVRELGEENLLICGKLSESVNDWKKHNILWVDDPRTETCRLLTTKYRFTNDELQFLEISEEQKKSRIKELQEERDKARIAEKIANEERDKAKAETRRIYANELAYKSQIALSTHDRNTAFRLAEFAHKYVDSGNTKVIQSMINALYYYDINPQSILLPRVSELNEFESHIRCVAFSQKDKFIATDTFWGLPQKGYKGIIKIWENHHGNPPIIIEAHNDVINCLSFLPDNKFLATGSDDGAVKIWNIENHRLMASLDNNIYPYRIKVNCLSVAHITGLIAVGTSDRSINLWDIHTYKFATFNLFTKFKPIATLEGHEDEITGIVFSPDNTLLASVSDDKTLRIWDISQKKEIFCIENHKSKIKCVIFSPDGKFIVTGSLDKTVKIWDIENEKNDYTFRGHEECVSCLAFSPDGKWLVSGSWDNSIKIWDFETGLNISTLKGHRGGITSVTFSNDGKILASGSEDETVRFWYLDKHKSSIMFSIEKKSRYDKVNSVIFSSKVNQVLAGSEDGIVRVWDIESQELISSIVIKTGIAAGVKKLLLYEDGKKLIATTGYSEVKIWDIENEKIINMLENPMEYSITCIAVSSDNQLLGGGTKEGIVKIWNSSDGSLLKTLKAEDDFSILSVAFDNTRRYIVAGDESDIVKIWDIHKQQIVIELNNGYQISCVKFLSNNNHLLVGYSRGAVIWDWTNSMDLIHFNHIYNNFISISISRDEIRLAGVSEEGGIVIWDILTGKPIISFKIHSEKINSISFSPDGNSIITGSSDNSVKIWELDAERLIQRWNDTGSQAPLSTYHLEENDLEDILEFETENENRLQNTSDIGQIATFAKIYSNKINRTNLPNKTYYLRARNFYQFCLMQNINNVYYEKKIFDLDKLWKDKSKEFHYKLPATLDNSIYLNAVVVNTTFLRGAPNLESHKIRILSIGELVQVSGQSRELEIINPNGLWFKVFTQDASEGWVLATDLGNRQEGPPL